GRRLPDLTINSVFANQEDTESGSINVIISFGNSGQAPAASHTQVYRLISLETGITFELLRVMVGSISPGNSLDRFFTLPLPENLPSGVYLLEIVLDPENAVPESNENNNTSSLDVELIGPSNGGLCENFEPNNEASQAALLPVPSTAQAAHCPLEDVDFYAFQASPDVNYTISVTPLDPDTPGAFSLSLFSSEQGFITQRFASEIALDITPDTEGTYTIRLVTSAQSDNFGYTLSIASE
ncbi:MAG: CARDB domain-containing protein, partial [Myxococcota bacterium]